MCIKYITLTRNSLLMQRWLVVINSTQTRVSWEGNASIPLDRLPSSLWSVVLSRGYFLTDDWFGRTQLTVGGTGLKQVILGCVRQQAEQAMESTSVRRIPLWPPLPFLPPDFYLEFLGFPDEGLSPVSQRSPSVHKWLRPCLPQQQKVNQHR